MAQDNLFTDADARARIVNGIKKVAQAVGGTMGTGGANAIIEVIESPGHLMTNDGYTIANSIRFADPLGEMGRKILVESINRANRASGDGSSTTCVLTAATILEGLDYLADESPMDIKRSLEECIPIIEASIAKQKYDIPVTEVGKVAAISAEDEGIGAMIQTIYEQIGKEGVIYWDISKTAQDTYTIGTGISVEGAGFFSPYMCDATESGQSTGQIRLKNARILITKQKVASAADFNDIGQMLNGQQVKDLVVFCDEIDPLVVADLVKTRMIRGFRFILVKMPTLWKDTWYEDLAIATGAIVIDPGAGLSLKGATMSHLGTVGNIVITKDDSFLDGIKDVSEHVKNLQADGSDEAMLRVVRLNTKTARYFVGAQSDSALGHRRLKVEDAISASWQALNGGIVAGGGSALVEVTYALPDTVGGKILKKALREPARQIAFNAGHPDMVVGDDYREGRGFDTRTRTFVDMIPAGIVDPANIVLNAAKNAISVAATVLTAGTIVTIPKQDEKVLQ